METAPLVPFQNMVSRDNDDDDDDDGRPDLRQLHKITTKIVNHGGVNLTAESDGGLLRNG